MAARLSPDRRPASSRSTSRVVELHHQPAHGPREAAALPAHRLAELEARRPTAGDDVARPARAAGVARPRSRPRRSPRAPPAPPAPGRACAQTRRGPARAHRPRAAQLAPHGRPLRRQPAQRTTSRRGATCTSIRPRPGRPRPGPRSASREAARGLPAGDAGSSSQPISISRSGIAASGPTVGAGDGWASARMRRM